MNCPSCQAPLVPDARFCGACGAPQRGAEVAVHAACAVHPAVRAVQPCPRCGTFACGECLVSLPGGSMLCRACESTGEATLLAWDRRSELGVLRAYWQTSLELIGKPRLTFDRARPTGTLGSSLGYTALSGLAGMFTTALLYGVIIIGVILFAGTKAGGEGPFASLGAGTGVLVGVGVFVVYLGALIGGSIANLVVLGSLDHLVLKILGVRPVWGVTMRAYALSQAPYLVGLIPVCGLYVYPIWSLVLRVFAYKSFHRTTWGKAVTGALAPTLVLVAVFVAAYVGLIAAVMASRGVE